ASPHLRVAHEPRRVSLAASSERHVFGQDWPAAAAAAGPRQGGTRAEVEAAFLRRERGSELVVPALTE
ncbi:unnamed protein product, partial [Prorocentrum cordatum]